MIVAPSRPAAKRSDRCFACGTHHPHGLRLRFVQDGEEAVSAVWRTDAAWQGFEGVIHGGIVTAVLDESMSHAVAAGGVPALTCELRVRLHHHVGPFEELKVRGWVVERHRRRIAAEATLKDGDGVERAHAWAVFLTPQP